MGRPGEAEGEQFRKLFIGGLDYRTTDESLKSFYGQWGEIVDVVVMKHPQTNKSRGFGFVTYSEKHMVDTAMANRPHKIDGRDVDSKRAVPRDESGNSNNINAKKMFVGGLKDQGDQELKDYFSQFGNIIGINIVMDKVTGKRKGYCFIEYDDYDPVDKALLQKNHSVGGKSLTVRKALPKDAQGGGPGGGRGPRGPMGRNNQWGGNPPNQWGGPPPQSNGWNGNIQGGPPGGGGYQQNYGGGPMRSTYNQNRSTPYGGGFGGGPGGWGGPRY